MLSGAAFSGAKLLEEKISDRTAREYNIRDRPCPKEYQEGLEHPLDTVLVTE